VPVLAKPASCLAAALQTQLSKEMVNMRLCGCQPYVEAPSDIFVTHSRNDHLRDLRFARGERRRRDYVVMRTVSNAAIGKVTQQATSYARRTRLLASPNISQESDDVGDPGSFWNITPSACLSPGNNLFCSFGYSNHYNWNLWGGASDFPNSRKAVWERLVKQHGIRLIFDKSTQGFRQFAEKPRD
jgi:hypothetical protein